MFHSVYQFKNGKFAPQEIRVVTEVPFRLVVDGVEIATMMCTPVKLRELALGFLAFERFIDSMDDIKSIEVDDEEAEAFVQLTKPLSKIKKRVFTSGCGGGVTFHLDIRDYRPIRTQKSIDPALAPVLIDQLHKSAVLYRLSRGIHTAAISNGEKLLAVAEDVGRHNALDKLIGEALEKGINTQDCILVSTGRISSEMLRKAARMETPFVISRTSPTSLSIAVAKRLGITLIGYVRRNQYNVYSHPENIAVGEGAVVGEPQNGLTLNMAEGEAGGERPALEKTGALASGKDSPSIPDAYRVESVSRSADRRGRRRRGNSGRKRDKNFMDIADQAFSYQVALSLWRDVENVMETDASSSDGSVKKLLELGDFEIRGAYAHIWRRNWEEALQGWEVLADPSERLERIRELVRKSVQEENEERATSGLPPILDEEEGQGFIGYALDRILHDAEGEIEEDL